MIDLLETIPPAIWYWGSISMLVAVVAIWTYIVAACMYYVTHSEIDRYMVTHLSDVAQREVAARDTRIRSLEALEKRLDEEIAGLKGDLASEVAESARLRGVVERVRRVAT